MTTAPVSEHAALLKSLDLPAKVALLTGATSFTLAAEPAIGLGEVRLSDGPTGVRGLKFSGGRIVGVHRTGGGDVADGRRRRRRICIVGSVRSSQIKNNDRG